MFIHVQNKQILDTSIRIELLGQVDKKNVSLDAVNLMAQMSPPIERVFPLAQPLIIDFGMDLWP